MTLRFPAWFALTLLAASLAACVEAPKQPMGLSEVIERPAERALLAGMRQYDDAQYAEAEQSLKAALGAGLVSPKDRAAANKLLAFIFCTSNRLGECAGAFRAARQADPGFKLSHSEEGHPLWGPVYKKVVAGS
jgi:Tfp pilus assembly protein PilF